MPNGKLESTLPTADWVGHPAVAAWLAFSGKTAAPEHIDVLRSTIYRLAGAGPAGTSVIVQYCGMKKALIERTVYDEILPHVPVTAPRFYGLKRETSDFAWMFSKMWGTGGTRMRSGAAQSRGPVDGVAPQRGEPPPGSEVSTRGRPAAAFELSRDRSQRHPRQPRQSRVAR